MKNERNKFNFSTDVANMSMDDYRKTIGDMANYYSERCEKYKRCFYASCFIRMGASALIPIISLFPKVDLSTIIVSVLAAIITITDGYANVTKCYKKWIQYRETEGELWAEQRRYAIRFDDYANDSDKDKIFVSRLGAFDWWASEYRRLDCFEVVGFNDNRLLMFMSSYDDNDNWMDDFQKRSYSVSDIFTVTNEGGIFPEEYVRDINMLLKGNASFICQDGILIPCDASALFPFGYFAISCNLTAGARMPLNVSRHNPSEIDSQLKPWFEKVGNCIQQTLEKGLDEMISSCSLKSGWRRLKKRKDSDSYFAKYCAEYDFWRC